jgi:tripartite-type tricarboxylate transporter receptor subunit TctC
LALSIPRRQLLRQLAGAAALPVLSGAACALDYPTRPVRIVLGFNAGGAPDVVARLLAQWLSEHSGQNFLVENRPGAGGDLATEAVVRAAPDGYTLLLVGSPNFINASLRPNPNFNLLRDVAPVASIGENPFLMVVNPSFPATTVAAFIADAKANPGKINMTSTGTGNLTHFAGELFKMLAGVDMLHVPARGEMPAQTDLLTGRVQVMFDPIISSIGYVKGGQLRALAVTSAKRSALLPDLPTVGEFVKGYAVYGGLGFGAPKDTPAETVDYLNRQINSALADPAVNVKLTDLGFVPVAMSPAEFGKFVADETTKWGNVIRTANIKAE